MKPFLLFRAVDKDVIENIITANDKINEARNNFNIYTRRFKEALELKYSSVT